MGMFNEIRAHGNYYQTKALGKVGSFGIGDPVEVQCVARTAAEYDQRPAFPYRQLPHEYTIAAVKVELDRPTAETTDVHFLVRGGRLIGLAGADDVERLPGFDYHGWHPDYEPDTSARPMPGRPRRSTTGPLTHEEVARWLDTFADRATAATGTGVATPPGSLEDVEFERALDERLGDGAE